jgi:hypothetical protein
LPQYGCSKIRGWPTGLEPATFSLEPQSELTGSQSFTAVQKSA